MDSEWLNTKGKYMTQKTMKQESEEIKQIGSIDDKMKNIVIIRGPSAVGKTTIAKNLLLSLKDKQKLNCAYIPEDHFRKKMQFKYKAEDKKAHINSVPIIKGVVKTLLKIDKWDDIIIEGLFRYKTMITEYRRFCKKNKLKLLVFQLKSTLKTRKQRNRKSVVRKHIVDLKTNHSLGKGEEIPIEGAIIVNTKQPIKKSVDQIISHILKKK